MKFANPECETSPINTDFGGPYPSVKDDGLTAVTFRLVAGNLTNQRLNTFLKRSGELIFKRQQNPVCSGLFTCYHFKDVARKREKSAVRNGNTRRSDQSTFNLRFYWTLCRRSLLSTSMIGEDLVQIMEVFTDKCFELNVYQTRKADNVMDTQKLPTP